MNELTKQFIDYLRLGNNEAELTEWLNQLAAEADDEPDPTANFIAWLAERRLDFIKQVDHVAAASRLIRVHYLEHTNGVIPRTSTIKPPHSLPNCRTCA